MSFLSPAFFLGFAAIIGPILIHLARKDDTQRIFFSSLMFVKELPIKTWKSQSLQNWPLLLLRMAGLIFLAIAFARPYLTFGPAQSFQRVSSKAMVALVDNSFSLRFGDHFEAGKQIVANMINGLSGDDTIQIALFSDTVQVLNSPTGNSRELMALLSGLRPGFRKSDYKAALKSALKLVSDSSAPGSEIHIISDFQETGWNPSSETIVDETVKVIPHSVCGPSSVNSAAHSPLFELQSTNEARFSIQVVSYGRTNPRKVPISLLLNGKLAQEKIIFLEANQSQLVEFDHISLPPGIITGQFALHSDDLLKDDDVCYFRINNQKPYRMLILSDSATLSNVYLNNALSAGRNSPFQIDGSDPGGIGAADFSRYSAVALNNVASIPPAISSALESYVEQGGKLLLILGPATNIRQLNSAFSHILPAVLFREHTSAKEVLAWQIGRIEREHQIFEVFRNSHLSQLRSVQISGFIECRPKDGSQVLVSLGEGYPLLLEKRIGTGSCVLYCSSMSIDWSDLPLTPVFVPFVQQIARHLANYVEDRTAYSVGDSIPLIILNPQLSKKISRISSLNRSFKQHWKVNSPSGEHIDLTDGRLAPSTFVTLDEQGFYTTEVYNVKNAVAVNADPRESDLECFDPEMRLASIRTQSLAHHGTELARGTGHDEAIRIESQQSLWRIFVAAALVVLLIETFVANRYYGRQTSASGGREG